MQVADWCEGPYQLTYQYLCIGDRQMAYTSYPRSGNTRDCEVPYTAKFGNLKADFLCSPQTGSDPARYSLGCGTLKEALVANNISTGPFMVGCRRNLQVQSGFKARARSA